MRISTKLHPVRQFGIMGFSLFSFYILWIFWFCTKCTNSSRAFSVSRLNDLKSSTNTTISSNVQEINTVIKKILIHFKNPNAVSEQLPIPDPFHRPDHQYSLPLSMKTTNVAIFGVSKLKMYNLKIDLVVMKITFDLHMPNISETGLYSCVLPGCSGSFGLNLINAYWNCNGIMKITKSGSLAVDKIEINLNYIDDMKIHIGEGGFIGDLLNHFGTLIFEGIKSYILSVIETNAQNYINEQLKSMKITLPNSIPPVDTFTVEARKLVKDSYDPFTIPNFLYSSNFLFVEVSQIAIRGISSFYRTGRMNLSIQNDTLQGVLNFGTDRLRGECIWEIDILGMYSKIGFVTFDVEHINISTNINQSLNLSIKPMITDMNIKLGNIQLISDGFSILEYAIEFVVNLICNWLRNQIIILFKTQIIYEAQNMLNKINVEDIIYHYVLDEKPLNKETFARSVKLIMQSTKH